MSYSMIVRGLTVALPLVALALLSTIFLVARTPPEDSSLPYVSELQGRADAFGDAMQKAFYTGTTEAGDAVTLRAETVRPDTPAPGEARAETVRADIRFQDGSSLRIDAATAAYRPGSDTLRLAGDVVLRSSTGYDLFTETLVADLDRGEARSDAPVRAKGPAGTIEAGGMALRWQDDETMHLVFTNRVKLVYRRSQPSE